VKHCRRGGQVERRCQRGKVHTVSLCLLLLLLLEALFGARASACRRSGERAEQPQRRDLRERLRIKSVSVVGSSALYVLPDYTAQSLPKAGYRGTGKALGWLQRAYAR
jgi:hypothetical protein